METYSKNSMKDMSGVDEMPPMKTMHSMLPMMEMNEMYQMMYVQSMYKMMHTMYGMFQMMNMKTMYMMNMQIMSMKGLNGMPPMMKIDKTSQPKPMYRQNGESQNDERQFSIPMLVNLQQLSPNQIQISYDMDVDVSLGMKATNYWIKDTMNIRPTGIATLGRNDNVNSRNSLTNNMVKIEQKNGSSKTFILTFNRTIPKGLEYMLIICYVTVKGAPPYSGDNGMATFVGM